MNDFNANEAPVKAKREIQRRKVAEAQKVIAEMSVSLSPRVDKITADCRTG
jgi:hypothetical protein